MDQRVAVPSVVEGGAARLPAGVLGDLKAWNYLAESKTLRRGFRCPEPEMWSRTLP
jgi:hypothetical protein